MDRYLGRKPRRQILEAALEQALGELARRSPNLHWAAVVSVDGLVHAMYDPFGKAEPDRTSAMAAAALSLGARISRELRHGGLTYAVIAGDQGLFVTYPIGEAFVLALSVPAEAEAGTTIETLTQARAGFASALYPGVG